jgi:DUF971 family protein
MTDQHNPYETLAPLSVVAEDATKQLFIEWSDGHTSRHPIEWLRWNCPCALCRGEMGMPGRLAGLTELRPEETRLEDVQPVGRYAIMLFWADGHHDGIFTYEMLRNTCHCEQCASLRSESRVPSPESKVGP